MRASRTADALPAVGRQDKASRTISFVGDDHGLVRALCERQPAAIAAFHDRYARAVLRIVVRILGSDPDLEDTVHDAFVRALKSIGKLRDPTRLGSWVTTVAVLSARTTLQRRYRRRWLKFMSHEDLVELNEPRYSQDPVVAEALRSTYAALDRLPTLDRIVFSLRFIDGMELTDIAEACRVSLATVKRRLRAAEARFSAIARGHTVLAEWVERGGRWTAG